MNKRQWISSDGPTTVAAVSPGRFDGLPRDAARRRMSGAALDALLYAALAPRRRRAAVRWPQTLRWHDTPAGRLRIYDSGGAGPAVLIAPDGPCVIEHYLPLAGQLAPDLRVLIVDLPGFGFSAPAAGYRHRLRQGAEALLAALDAAGVGRATLALSCVNGYYAVAASALAPQRVAQLLLAQTPAPAAMQAWTARMVPAPIRVPLLGQLLNFATRRRIAHGWFGAALARREDRPAFRAVADTALDDGGCYCFAGVVQGMRGTHADDPLLRSAAPVTLVWGGADRSHRDTDPASLQALLPQTRIVGFDEAGHFPDLEQPERYARLLRTLLAAAH